MKLRGHTPECNTRTWKEISDLAPTECDCGFDKIKKKKRQYPKVNDGEPTEIRWRTQSMRFACCDCGLVHSFEFKVSEAGEIIEVTLFGQNRSTAQLRRQKSTNLQTGKVKKWKMTRK